MTALLAEQEIAFDYVHFDGTREKAIRVQPLTLALHEHQFYVISRRGEAPPHPFRFARMTNVRLGKKAAYPKEGTYHPKRLFHSVFGIFVGQPNQPVQRVRLRFAPKWRDYVESHRWHHTQTEHQVDAHGSTEVLIEVRVCHELRAWILGLGPDVEVLEPASLRKEIRLALESAVAVYRTPGLATATPKRTPTSPRHRARSRRAARRGSR
jgi:predicted DNA-binding transcriptional regulator YafY